MCKVFNNRDQYCGERVILEYPEDFLWLPGAMFRSGESMIATILSIEKAESIPDCYSEEAAKITCKVKVAVCPHIYSTFLVRDGQTIKIAA